MFIGFLIVIAILAPFFLYPISVPGADCARQNGRRERHAHYRAPLTRDQQDALFETCSGRSPVK